MDGCDKFRISFSQPYAAFAARRRTLVLTGVDGFAARFLQSASLEIGWLLFSGDATIAGFYASILTMIYDACNLLFLQR